MESVMIATIRSKFLNDTGVITQAKYIDGSLAVTFTAPDGEPLATLSVNLADHGIIAPPDCFYVKNYSEGEGLAAALEIAGVAEYVLPLRVAEFGQWGTTASLMRMCK